MRAMFITAPGSMELREVPLPELRDDEVLVRLGYCGICPWDLRAFDGQARGVQFPRLLGHEAAGHVIQIGAAVQSVAVGQPVVVDFVLKCGTCEACRQGLSNLCLRPTYGKGGFAEAVIVPERNVFPFCESTPLAAAAFAEPLSCVLRGERMLEIQPGQRVLVMGVGPIGLMHVQIARRFGARVLAADLRPERLEMASRLGAEVLVNPSEQSLSDVVMGVTNGYGVDAAVVAVGSARLIEQAVEVLARGGRLNIFAGVYPKALVQFDPNLIHYRELKVMGSSDSTHEDMYQALRLIESGQVDVLSLISHTLPLERLAEGFALVRQAQGLKVMIDLHDRDPDSNH
jgi:L-iditol 2-dehydrogenase